MNSAEKKIREILSLANVTINGKNPWDFQVKNPAVYRRVLGGGTLALGESYMDSWWDMEDLSGFFFRLFSAGLRSRSIVSFPLVWNAFVALLMNLQNRARAFEVAEKHYDLDNDLYMSFLDPYNQYTCGYFKDTDDLNVAQEQKLDLMCRKLQLKPSDRVLDIGCGWGGFARFAAERYGCHVTGISISDAQIA